MVIASITKGAAVLSMLLPLLFLTGLSACDAPAQAQLVKKKVSGIDKAKMGPGKSSFVWKQPAEYYIHHGIVSRHLPHTPIDGQTKYWNIRGSGKGGVVKFEGTVQDLAKHEMGVVPAHHEGRALKAEGNVIKKSTMKFSCEGKGGTSKADSYCHMVFISEPTTKCYRFELKADGKKVDPSQIFLGASRVEPKTNPFDACIK